ncbi:sigma 54-interacting transcriptional regulator [bacterium]|nr:sigma 54-interacting transcriptional regulator [bacterium]
MKFLLILAESEDAVLTPLSKLQQYCETALLESGDPVDTIVQGEEPYAILYFDSFGGEHESHLKTLRQIYPGIPSIFLHDLPGRISKRSNLEPLVHAFLSDVPPISILWEIIETHANRLKTRPVPRTSVPEDLLSNQVDSPLMQRILKMASKVAPTDATILISGESGTGKEVLAKWIHLRSSRKNKPFIAVNCGAIPENLLESELFGHKKGAFTGADKDKQGLFDAAHHGTILLDEIGEMPLTLQVKLLRVLQDRRIRPVGGIGDIPVNVRVVGATNKNLKNLVMEGLFREDLFYRFNVVPLTLPPLRERKETLRKLIDEFFLEFTQKYRRVLRQISPSTLNILMNYPYPGNIRELQNILEFAVIMCESNTIQPQDLPAELHRDAPLNLLPAPESVNQLPVETLHDFLKLCYNLETPTIEDAERVLIMERMDMFMENQKQVAESLGISRTSLWRKLKEYKLAKGEPSS